MAPPVDPDFNKCTEYVHTLVRERVSTGSVRQGCRTLSCLLLRKLDHLPRMRDGFVADLQPAQHPGDFGDFGIFSQRGDLGGRAVLAG